MTMAWVGVCVGLLTLCAYYPFLPGEYDGLAVALSRVAQVVSLAALLFVPVGALGLIHGSSRGIRRTGPAPERPFRAYYAVAGLMAYAIVAILASGAAWATSGRAFGCVTLAFALYVLSRLWPALTPSATAATPLVAPALLGFTMVPIGAVLLQALLANPAIDFARTRAIDSSAELIAALERYHAAHGNYPQALSGVWADYKVSVVGVSHFHYAPHGGAYNLYFEQPLPLWTAPGTREFVVYNPRDEHIMLSHAAWNVTRAPGALGQGQGWYAVRNLPRPHWRAFRFD